MYATSSGLAGLRLEFRRAELQPDRLRGQAAT
jgi:hypothetical protein